MKTVTPGWGGGTERQNTTEPSRTTCDAINIGAEKNLQNQSKSHVFILKKKLLQLLLRLLIANSI